MKRCHLLSGFLPMGLFIGLFGAIAAAQVNSWTSAGNGSWETDGNWSAGAPSSNQTALFVTNDHPKTVTIDATTSGSFPTTLTVSNLTLSAPPGSLNTLSLNDAGIQTPMVIRNAFTISSGGALVVTNSALVINGVAISQFGSSFIVNGTVLLDGGSITATNKTTYIGNSGSGQMVIANGSFVTTEASVTYGANSQGTLTIAGGSLVMPAFYINGLGVGSGSNSTGTVWVTGGQAILSNTSTSIGRGGSGQMTISNGLVFAGEVNVGYSSVGTLTVAGGVTHISDTFSVGLQIGSRAAVWITGGQLVATNEHTIIGGKDGQMTVSNGIVLLEAVQVGDPYDTHGILRVAGGSVSCRSGLSVGSYVGSTGSVWVTGGQLDVTNADITVGGGALGRMTVSNGLVLAAGVRLGGDSAGTLTMAGGTMSLSGGFDVGHHFYTQGTGTLWVTGGQLMVTNGSLVVGYNETARMTLSNGTVLARDVTLGASGFCQGTLTVAGATLALSSNLIVGVQSLYTNTVLVTGGKLSITNSSGDGTIVVGQSGLGTFILKGGAVTADRILACSGMNSVFTFTGGTLDSGGTAVTNALPFIVGNGTNTAVFHLNGGIHSFANGLRIRPNAMVTGCGTISGSVLVDPGATMLTDCGGRMTLTGVLTNNGTMRAINGSMLEFYGSVVNNGTIDVVNGWAAHHGSFVNNGTVLGTILDANSVRMSNINVSGNDVTIRIWSVTGYTYQLQMTPSLDSPAWANAYAPQPGTGGMLTFADPDGMTNQPSRFYRIQVTAP